MHELSLCKSILKIIKQYAHKSDCLRVKTVFVEIGELVAIEPTALIFGFKLICKGTVAEEAILEIISIPGIAQCNTCQGRSAIKQYYESCKNCGSNNLEIIAGEEFNVKSMEIE